MLFLGGMASSALGAMSLLQPQSGANPASTASAAGSQANGFLSQVSGRATASSASAPTGTASPLLSSNVLGFLIQDQSQQSGPTGPAAASATNAAPGTGSDTDTDQGLNGPTPAAGTAPKVATPNGSTATTLQTLIQMQARLF
jgi:hypothetical protein